MSDASDVADLATAQALIVTLRDELTRTQRENATLRHQRDVCSVSASSGRNPNGLQIGAGGAPDSTVWQLAKELLLTDVSV